MGRHIRNGFHALALDENRVAYKPVIWQSREGWEGQLKQIWFRGLHKDIGGQYGNAFRSRGLSNIPLAWMLKQLEKCGLELPENWQSEFPTDEKTAQSSAWAGLSKFFLARQTREVGKDASEALHPSVPEDHPICEIEFHPKKADAVDLG